MNEKTNTGFDEALATAQAEWKNERERLLREARQRRLERIIPPLFADATADNPNALEWIVNPQGTLLLTGPVGSGKTHLAWALVRMFMDDPTQLTRKAAGYSVAQMLHYLRPGNALQRPKTIYDEYGGSKQGFETVDVMHECQTVDLLIVDDVGTEKLSEWGAEQLWLIVDHRYQHRLPTIVATNVRPAELAGFVGDRIASRWAFNSTVIPVVGADRRRRPA